MGSRIGGFFKRLGRKTARIHTRINRVFVPVASTAAGYFLGAPGAAAVTAIGAQSSYYFRATEARAEGIRGRRARDFGRKERKRVAIYGAIGGGAGMLGSGVTSLVAGKSVLESLGAVGLGQVGGNIVGINTAFSKPVPVATPFGGSSAFVTPANLAGQQSSAVPGLITQGNFSAQQVQAVPGLVTQAQLTNAPGSAVPGLVTQAQLSQQLAGGATAAEASASTGSTSVLAKALGLTAETAAKSLAGTPGGASPTGPGSDSFARGLLEGLLAAGGGGGGGGSGDPGGGGFGNSPMGNGQGGISPGIALALGVGALLLIA